ncbi:hypothetical protein TorRG33x02_177480 [Trema orientale]|uniref:Uncharacterized protein n=1 Tax=Trema orientale TaxID=63057 RepID=A0A2P5ELF9_TREOI|nr:hypothetical protein TorRG33x02_177480 [Trema orientale]
MMDMIIQSREIERSRDKDWKSFIDTLIGSLESEQYSLDGSHSTGVLHGLSISGLESMTCTGSGIEIGDILVYCDEECTGLEGGLVDGVQIVGNEVSVEDDLADKVVKKLNYIIGGEASNRNIESRYEDNRIKGDNFMVRSENKGDGYGNDFMVREDNRHGYNDDHKSDDKTKLMATEICRDIEIVELYDTEEIVCVSEKISSMDCDGIFLVDNDNAGRSIMEKRVVEYKKLTRREKQLNHLYDPIGAELEEEIMLEGGKNLENDVLNDITGDEILNLLNNEILSNVLCMLYATEVVNKSYGGAYPIACAYPCKGSNSVKNHGLGEYMSELIRSQSENCMLPDSAIRKYIFRTEME